MARVYIESSFFSACVSTRTDAKSAGWRASSTEWWETQRSHHELYLTWNVRHLANPNKRMHLAVICLRLGRVPPLIVTPDMLQEADHG